ncbi:ribokinase [Photobacterium leiognathi]|uniref:ribokinase n=1 Tax=Photobacterium leiognathi TaxID=553611 RepID=UPI001EDEF663|nr:ribokinase [Photobacterium leiognathi]MCG3884839.1 ribokinase [Photobacterium leiognathi]
MTKVAVIGSNMVDLIAYTNRMPKEGETLEAPSFQMGCGGKGANQAVACAKLGTEVIMVSKVGDDLFADNTITNFEQHGIDTAFVSKISGVSSGVAPIFVNPSSQNSILIIKGANEYLKPDDIDKASVKLKDADLIVLQLEIPLDTVYHAIEFANKHDIQVLLNPAPAVPGLDIEYACRCDYFVPNETELEILVNKPVNTIDEIREAAKVLLDKGLQNVIVTMGARGSLWLSKTGDERLIEPVPVKAIDTSGAGDAFIGCFSHFLVQTGNTEKALKYASAYAAISVTGKGTQSSYPNVAEFNEFAATYVTN